MPCHAVTPKSAVMTDAWRKRVMGGKEGWKIGPPAGVAKLDGESMVMVRGATTRTRPSFASVQRMERIKRPREDDALAFEGRKVYRPKGHSIPRRLFNRSIPSRKEPCGGEEDRA